jgi:hypothetical protein
MTPIQVLAADYTSRFHEITRDDGSKAMVVQDGKDLPELTELCHAAHGDMLPDDERYHFIIEALDALAECEDTEGARDSIEADIYTHELTAWLASRNDRFSYCDEAAEEFGYTGKDEKTSDGKFIGTMELIALGQWCEKLEVFDSVLSSLEEIVEGMDDEEGEAV